MPIDLDSQGSQKLARAKRNLDEGLYSILLFAKKRAETRESVGELGQQRKKGSKTKVFYYIKRERLSLWWLTSFGQNRK